MIAAAVTSVALVVLMVVAEDHLHAVLVSVGLGNWRFYQRPIDTQSYDLVLASVAGSVSVALTLYFTIAAGLVALRPERDSLLFLRRLYGTWWLFPPGVSALVILELLIICPFGVRPYHAAVPLLGSLGALSIVSLTKLAQLVLGSAGERRAASG